MAEQGRWVLGITGASGAVYGVRLLELLVQFGVEVDLVCSEAGRIVVREETGIDLSGESPSGNNLDQELRLKGSAVQYYRNSDLINPLSSGSSRRAGMVIAPCSMGTLAALSQGLADNLIRRSADVMIKQKRPLILLPRETPLSAIHLENMLRLARLGVVILPPMPAFYHKPESLEDLVDFVVGRVLDVMGIDHHLYRRWQDEL